MIKTIKVKKKLKFVDLLQWIKTNDIRGREFKDVNREYFFSVLEGGCLNFDEFTYDNDALYEVEVEEEITEDTVFQTLVAADSEGDACMMNKGTINEIQDSITTEIYANINGKLELIWEAE